MTVLQVLTHWPLCVPSLGVLGGLLLLVMGFVWRSRRDRAFGAMVIVISILSGVALFFYLPYRCQTAVDTRAKPARSRTMAIDNRVKATIGAATTYFVGNIYEKTGETETRITITRQPNELPCGWARQTPTTS